MPSHDWYLAGPCDVHVLMHIWCVVHYWTVCALLEMSTMLLYLTETSSNQPLEKCIARTPRASIFYYWPKTNYVYVEVGSNIYHLFRPHEVQFGDSSCHGHLQAIPAESQGKYYCSCHVMWPLCQATLVTWVTFYFTIISIVHTSNQLNIMIMNCLACVYICMYVMITHFVSTLLPNYTLLNLSCELWIIMIRFDFIEANTGGSRIFKRNKYVIPSNALKCDQYCHWTINEYYNWT